MYIIYVADGQTFWPIEIREPMAMADFHIILPGLQRTRTTELLCDTDGCLTNVLLNDLVKEGSSEASRMMS